MTLPDADVANAFRACLADLFIMREPVPGGSVRAVPGTEVYRAANVYEAAVVAIALDQLGFHQEAMRGYEWCLENQEADGNWNEPRNWGHTMWSCSGFECWAAMEHAAVRSLVADAELSKPERYVVLTVRRGEQSLGVIAGADARGVAYGVYALLEKLGCGFYLSYDAWPPAREGPFTMDGWALANAPLVRERLVFEWHNFLSGCSTWNLVDWNRWTDQSLKMGYNAIMVHAYGYNPMVRFTFHGRTKPAGQLSTTRRGRDWSTMPCVV